MQDSVQSTGLVPKYATTAQPTYDIPTKPADVRRSSAERALKTRRSVVPCDSCCNRQIQCEVEGSKSACMSCLRLHTQCVFGNRQMATENLPRYCTDLRDELSFNNRPTYTEYVRHLEERVQRTASILKAARTAGLVDDVAVRHSNTISEDDSSSEEDDDPVGEPFLGNRQRRRYQSFWFKGQKAAQSVSAKSSFGSSGQSSSPASTAESLDRGQSHRASKDMQVPLWKIDERDESRYIGRASSLSILSQEGIDWIKEKAGDDNLRKLLSILSAEESAGDCWRADVFHDLFASHVFKPLPPRAEVFALLRDYFRTVNCLFPIYHELSFMRLVEWQYTQQKCDDAARWASINIMISLAYEYRFSNSLKPDRDKERAWAHFKNAIAVFTELAVRRTDLLSVQALLGMAIFLRGNAGSRSTLPVVTAAMRSCHRLGLHRNVARPGLSAVEEEQRKRVFWIAYILDQSTSIRAGIAPIQHANDYDVDFPEEVEKATDVSADTHRCKLPFFIQLCRLTAIRGRIYSELYSTKAQESNPETLCNAVGELAHELQTWVENNPLDIVKKKTNGKDHLRGFGKILLKLVYYNSLIMIHRVPLFMQYYYSRPEFEEFFRDFFDAERLTARATTSNVLCMQAARDTLKLVSNMPWGNVAWIWSMLYYVFLAVIMIFVNILKNTKHSKATEDLQALNMATTFFTTLKPTDGPLNYAKFMAKMCANFERTAKAAIERDEKESKARSDDRDYRDNGHFRVPAVVKQEHENNSASAGHISQQQASQEVLSSQPSETSHCKDLLSENSPGYNVSNDSATSDTRPGIPFAFATTDPFQQPVAVPPPSAPPQATTSPSEIDPRQLSSQAYRSPPIYFSSMADRTAPQLFQMALMPDWQFAPQVPRNHPYHNFHPQPYLSHSLVTPSASMLPQQPQQPIRGDSNMPLYAPDSHLMQQSSPIFQQTPWWNASSLNFF